MILILGVTASGKSRLSFDLAQSLDAEIISIDSMKVYRRMDIGTAKPSKEAREKVKYHLVDIIEPSESFSVGAFHEQATQVINQIKAKNKQIIGVGGTALYIKSLLFGLFEGAGTDENIRKELQERILVEGSAKLHLELSEIDPIAAERINPNDSKRIIRALEVYKLTGNPISSFQKQWDTHNGHSNSEQNNHGWNIIGIRRDKVDENSRINQRVKRMILSGLVDEVKSLLSEEKPLSRQARCAIGYAEIIDYLNGKTDLKQATELIKINTRRLAKGQRTWFKTFRNVHWLDIETEEPYEKTFQRIRTLIDEIGP